MQNYLVEVAWQDVLKEFDKEIIELIKQQFEKDLEEKKEQEKQISES